MIKSQPLLRPFPFEGFVVLVTTIVVVTFDGLVVLELFEVTVLLEVLVLFAETQPPGQQHFDLNSMFFIKIKSNLNFID